MIGTMRRHHSASNSTSSAGDLQLSHHQFRWVLFSVHADEPVRRLLDRHLRRRLADAEATDAGHLGTAGATNVS